MTTADAGPGLTRQQARTLSLAALGGALEFYDFVIFVFFATTMGALFFPADMPEWLRQLQTFGSSAEVAGRLGAAYVRGLRGASFGEGVTAEQGVLQLIGLRWDVIIFDAHMRIGCQMHPLSDWASFDDRRIAEMDGVHALRFWRQHKSALLTLAQRGNAPAAIAKAEGGAA